MKAALKANRRNNAFVLSQFLIAIAVFMRVVIPQGFMLGESQFGANGKAISIIICTAQGDLPAIMDANGDISFDNRASKDHDEKKSNSNSHCTFASALSDASFAPAAFNYVEANWNFAFLRSQIEVPQIGLGLAAPPPPKTGPPIHI